MTFRLPGSRVGRWARAGLILAGLAVPALSAQTGEKAFPQSKAVVEKALKGLQANLAGHLPALEGFAQPGEHALDRYQRAYYQATVQVNATASGGSLVKVRVKVTAWYNDPSGAHSGYQLLTSNGRLESDLLDQLADQVASNSGRGQTAPVSAPRPESAAAAEPAISVPAPSLSEKERTFSSSRSQSLTAEEREFSNHPSQPAADPATKTLQAEADTLEETLKNQAHPKNLVAVKKSGTPVVATPSLTAKPEFLASLHDEFEMLDFNRDWVHVRVSGLSRGWIWRNSVEMPEGIPETEAAAVPAQAAAGDLFHVTREEDAPFPGVWEPLRGKTVKILSVQRLDETAKEASARDRLEYAKFLLDKSYTEMSKKTAAQEPAGVVVIFDSADGGMIAATLATLQQWRAGTLSDSALWHQCFFDPPETFDSTGTSASQ